MTQPATLADLFAHADRNLLFGVLALQVDLLDAAQFAEACTAWTARKHVPLAEQLVERGWLTPADRADVERLLERKLRKHGDARAGLDAVADAGVRHTLAGIADVDVRQSLAGPVLPSTVDHLPAAGDRYTLRRLHATGGIGRVWLARDARLGRDVALKELRPERAGDPRIRGRFLKEAQITGQLEHPGIVPVYELCRGPDGEQSFYTMRFVKGRTLSAAAHAYHQKRLAGREESLELLALLNAFVVVCNTVAYAHSRGVLHRDLKGQNVVLGDFGEVIVLDWGLAKLVDRPEGEAEADPVVLDAEGTDHTVQGQTLGTPAYMAPEQAAGRLDLIGPHTDVYGLGAMLYKILTGQPPFAGADTREVLRKVREEEPVAPRQQWAEVPPALEALCLRALAKDRAGRPASAAELAQEVQQWQELQRRQAEEALRRQTELLGSILNSMGDSVVVADADGKFLLWNPAAERLLGIGSTDTPMEGWAEKYGCFLPDRVTLYATDDLPLVRAVRGEAVDDCELFMRNPDVPEGVRISVNARPIRDEHGALCGGVAVVRDVTERKRTEEALRRAEAELARVRQLLEEPTAGNASAEQTDLPA